MPTLALTPAAARRLGVIVGPLMKQRRGYDKSVRVARVKLPPGVTAPLTGTAPWVRLSPPPSTNNLYATVGRKRVKSSRYVAWIERELPRLRELRPALPPVRICVALVGAWREHRDGGANVLKPLEDLVKRAGFVPDDNLKHVRGGMWEYQPDANAAAVVVWLETVEVM